MCMAEEITTLDQCDDYSTKFEYPDKVEFPSLKHPARVPKHITISTTLSAGEFTNIAGMTDSKRQVKEIYLHPPLMPVAAYLDPTLAVHTPGWLWASTGMRAVDHCVEAYVSQAHMPFVDALSKDALTILAQELPNASRNPEDIGSRGRCQMACWMSLFGLLNVMVGPQPRHRPPAWGPLRRPPWRHLVHHASARHGLQLPGCEGSSGEPGRGLRRRYPGHERR